MQRTPVAVLIAAAVVIVVAVQGVTDRDERAGQGRVSLTVLAASSLQGAFEEMAAAFEREHQNVDIVPSYAGSATLATQITQGAAVDVVAMADSTNMAKVTESGDIVGSSVRTFAMNRLAVIVPGGNPRRISSLADLENPGISVVLCDPTQPCGKYAAQMLAGAGVSITPRSLEASASGVVARVRSGEADAGISYVSDSVTAEGIGTVTIPISQNITATYPIGVAKSPSSGSPSDARRFVDFVMSKVGQAILKSAGFISR